MSINVNCVHLGGQVYNLKRAETKSGKPIAKFTISTWKKMKDKDDRVSFHDCVAFGDMGEAILRNLKDKERIFITGEIEMMTSPEGKRYTQILVNEFSFVDKRSE